MPPSDAPPPRELMNAVVVTALAGPAAAVPQRVPVPTGSHRFSPGRRMLIEVHAAGIAYPDVLMSLGKLQLSTPPPYVAGAEAAGIVVEAPPGAGFLPGERVAGTVLGGALAEYALMRPDYTLHLPDRFDFVQGAALHLNYTTAWLALEKAAFTPGDVVLILGAAGGVGTAALDLVAGAGGTSIAVVSTARKEAVARQVGATHVMRYDDQWLRQVKEVTNGRGADIVLDPVGGPGFTDHVRALRTGGRLLVIGFAGGEIPSIRTNWLLLRNLSLIGFDLDVWDEAVPGTARRASEAVARLASSGMINPYVGKVYPFEDAAAAIQTLQRRQALGKTVVTVRRPGPPSSAR